MARKANTVGSVKERPRRGSGKFYAYLPASMVPANGQPRIPGVFASKTLARAALNDYIADLRANRRRVPITGRSLKVADAVQQYIDYRSTARRARWAARTQEGYRAALRNQIKHPKADIGKIALTTVTPPVVYSWLENLQEAGVPNSRIQYARWLLSGTIQWFITKGDFVGSNPVGEVHEFWSKSSTKRGKSRLVLIPTWAELATLVQSPKFYEDRLLIALMAWSGLRWSEAISLRTTDLWRDRPVVSVSRVFVWTQSPKGAAHGDPTSRGKWREEVVKGGVVGRVDLPTPLWKELLALADHQEERGPCREPFGSLLFRGAHWTPEGSSEGFIDNRNWNRDVWREARKAAGLTGDSSRSVTEARRKPMLVKDLRAFAASVLVDAGATPLEASVMLRHQDSRTTQIHYLRAQGVEAHDPDRVSLRNRTDLTLPQRLDALWELWSKKYPKSAASLRPPKNRSTSSAKKRAAGGRGKAEKGPARTARASATQKPGGERSSSARRKIRSPRSATTRSSKGSTRSPAKAVARRSSKPKARQPVKASSRAPKRAR